MRGLTWDDIGMMIGQSLGNAYGTGIGMRQYGKELRLANEALDDFNEQQARTMAEQGMDSAMQGRYGVGYQPGMTYSDARKAIDNTMAALDNHIDAVSNGTGIYKGATENQRQGWLAELQDKKAELQSAASRVGANAPEVQGPLGSVAAEIGKPREIADRGQLYDVLYGGGNGLSYADSMNALTQRYKNAAILDPDYIDAAEKYLREKGGLNPMAIQGALDKVQSKIASAKRAEAQGIYRDMAEKYAAAGDDYRSKLALAASMADPDKALGLMREFKPEYKTTLIDTGNQKILARIDQNGNIVGTTGFDVSMTPHQRASLGLQEYLAKYKEDMANARQQQRLQAADARGANGRGAGAPGEEYTNEQYNWMRNRANDLEKLLPEERTPAQNEELKRLHDAMGRRTETRIDPGDYKQMASAITGMLEEAVNDGATMEQARESVNAYIKKLYEQGDLPDEETFKEYLRMINDWK